MPPCGFGLLVGVLFSVRTDGSWNWTQNQSNESLQDPFSGRFGSSELAGVRAFPPEQEMESRIIGGQEAWAHSWPWQVSLQFSSMPTCGGAVIAAEWVVSAAHCFSRFNSESLWTVLAGKHDLDKPQEPEEQLVQVLKIIIHHQYNTRTKDCDLALVKLERPLIFNQFVRPIDLWMTPLPEHMKCTITGWGSTHENGPRVNRLQEVNVSILAFDVCNDYYKGRILPSMFCAGKDEGGLDACQGDSGGPLSCFTGTRHKLAGVVSWGVGCGRARKPGVYSKLQQHILWISDAIDEVKELPVELPGADTECGKLWPSSCDRPPSLASISVSRGGAVWVENVTESCPFSWPWMVSLQSNRKHFCSGVLIHQRWVVTAKHCSVSPKEDVVVLGVHDLKRTSVQTLLVDEVFSPVNDAGFPPHSDLSLLRLSAAARFGPQVSPVCIPEEDEELDDSWTCIAAGWGNVKTSEGLSPDRLHHAKLTLVNESTCIQKWGDLITEDHICSEPVGSASCMGDAGAPLFCWKHGSFFLFGVVTWGSWRCSADKPAIFTRMAEFHSWISDVIDL
ncbi:Transmembrane protease serine 9 [Oryzias melastigma]|uniref:Ovochymase 1 n=1 Tax=Oryzias melastigma TaxID=30732 RepID=A0A3B3DVK3_ORYME|nr:ovochymase-1 [Oryzias melastigma]KAF6738432.1 Transmembrane protease serine 9 [Oryzias melastigma]